MAMPYIDAQRWSFYIPAKILASRWLWCAAAIVFVAGGDIVRSLADLSLSLGDTDDATRLYQVRHLLATGAWFDMTLPKLGGANPLISHWSRLIDCALVLLLQGLGLAMPSANAELAMRVMWPLLVLFAFLCILARAANQQSGPTAVAVLLALAITSIAGLGQFHIGRIDHHNVMICGAIGGLLLLLQVRQSPREGYIAGALIGVALGVGYEPLLFLVPCLAAAALLAIYDTEWLPGVRNMSVALTGTLGLIAATTIAPSLWLEVRCDAISLNMLTLCACSAVGLAIIEAHGRRWSLGARLTTLTATGIAGLVAFGALDKRCLAGPFGQVDPAINAVWLDHVMEMQSIFSLYKSNPDAALAVLATLALGLFAAIERQRQQRSSESRALLGMMMIVAPAGMWMLKLMPYANWLATFCIALSIANLKSSGRVSALSRQLVAIIITAQWTLVALVGPLVRPANASGTIAQTVLTEVDPKCLSTPAIRALAALPTGRFVGSIDFGAYIVALTPHEALAAPYHRIDQAILANHRILTAPPDLARQLLRDAKADYVILCITPEIAGKEQPASNPRAGLSTQLKSERLIAWLQPVTFHSPVAELRVWRVLPEASQ